MEKICQLGDILFTKYSYFSTCWDYGHTFSTDYSKVIGSPFVLLCCRGNLQVILPPTVTSTYYPLFPPLSSVGIVSNRIVELANEKIGVFKQ